MNIPWWLWLIIGILSLLILSIFFYFVIKRLLRNNRVENNWHQPTSDEDIDRDTKIGTLFGHPELDEYAGVK